MSLLDRIHDSVVGLGDAIEAPIGFVKDLATSPFDNRGMVSAIYHDFTDRGAQLLGGAVGPQGFTGSLIGGLPEGARSGVNEIIKPAEGAMDLAYRDLIGRPVSTALEASAISQAGHGGTSGGLFNLDSWHKFTQGSTWAEAWDISAHQSPGQSAALAFMTKDITDPNQVKKAQASDYYSLASGTVDAALRWFDDPTQVALGSATGYLKELHTVNSQEAIAKLTANGAISRFASDVMTKAAEHDNNPDILAARLRNDYFPKTYLGGQMSSVLAHAATTGTAADVERVTRIGLGSSAEVEILRGQDAALAAQMDRLMQRREAVSALGTNGWLLNNSPDDLVRQDAELKQLYDEQARLNRLNLVTAQMTELPHPSTIEKARSALTRSDWYQNGIMSKPLRVVFNQSPSHLVQYDSAMSDSALFHFMQSSDLPLDRQLELRGQYLNAETNGARKAIANIMHDEAIQSIADSSAVVSPKNFDDWISNVPGKQLDEAGRADYSARYAAAKGREAKLAVLKEASTAHDLPLPGLSVAEMQGHLAMAATLRDATAQILKGRRYDGEGRAALTLEGEDGVAHQLITHEKPLYETQLADLEALPDLKQYRSIATKTGQFRALHPTTDLPAELARGYYNVWKPATLLRIGFPVRFVTDEALRSIAKIGALATAENMARGASSAVKDTAAYMLGKVGVDLEKSAIGAKPLLENGYALEGAFGISPGDGASIYKYLSKARQTFGRDVVTAEGGIYDELVKTGDWKTFAPTEHGYGNAWQRDVNIQIGNSDLGRKMLEAKLSDRPETAVADTAKWLRSTPEGQRVAREVGRTEYADWAQRVSDQIDAYLPTDNLKMAALGQSATHELLASEVPDILARPLVHGEVLAQDLGHSKITKAWNNIVQKGYDALADKPSGYLIRNPFFDHMYQAEVRRQVQLLTGEREFSFSERMARRTLGLSEQSTATGLELTGQDLERIQYRARQYALNQTKDLFHDFSKHSELAHSLRYIVPFFSAWNQILTRWAGIAVENPAFVRRMDMLWRAPEKAGVVTDGKGNLLDQNDNISHAVPGGPWKVGDKAADGQRNITLSIPSWAKDVPIVGGVAGRDKIKFGKDSINLLLHGFPTAGPLAQVPLNEIAKDRPDAAAALKWALPYGPSQSSFDLLKPTIVRHVSQAAEGDANRSYAYTVMQIYNDGVVDYNLGKRATPPTIAEAKHNADSFEKVKILAGYTLPVSPQFVSPYQPYIDAYRARLTYDGTLTPEQKNAPDYVPPKEWFLKTYGDEFFPLTTSMSKSIDGIPPTVEGYKIRQDYKDLIGQYPELGALVVGQSGAGSFSQAVYDSQFQTHTAPGGPTERTVRSYQEFATAPNTELGWINFSQTMDMIDGLRIQRNLPSLNVKGAEDLAAMKKNLVYNLAIKYPSWYEDYMSTDATKWDRRIQGMTAITENKGLMARPEFQGLSQYLQGRAQLISVLNASQSQSLNAQANAQLAQQWDNFTANLVAENPAFGALYYRWLQNDPVPITPLTAAATAGTLVSAVTG